jgi:putative alpha-1,2-mannosidase
MGLFQMDGGCAVKPVYEISGPLFEKITIHLDERYYPGGTFVIEAPGVSRENRYIQSALLDGKTLDKPWMYQSELADGGTLRLEMGPEPNEAWGSAPSAAPPQ